MTHLIALLKDWSVDVGTNAVLDQRMSQLRGTRLTCRCAAQYPFHAITNTSGC